MPATTIIPRTAVQQLIEARFGLPIDQLLAERYSRGMTQQEIADDLGASRASVIRWMQRLGLETRRPGEKVA
jgi:CRP-like cAMP-binding protein